MGVNFRIPKVLSAQIDAKYHQRQSKGQRYSKGDFVAALLQEGLLSGAWEILEKDSKPRAKAS